MYVVIMAGGSGTRLWPMSRRDRPKQFQALISDRTLLQETFERLRPVAAPEEIFVATTDALVAHVFAQLDELPAENILVEPVGRNTGPAIGYAAAFFARSEPDAVVATVHSDHIIGRPERFIAALRLAHETITQQPEMLMTIGLEPTWGNPGFGYIKARREANPAPGVAVLGVERFEEKPSAERAAAYVASGDYFWNAGYFVFRAETMMRRLETYNAALYRGLRTIAEAVGGPQAGLVLEREYAAFDHVPIDRLVFEPESRAGRVLVIPAALEWDDIGSWKSLHDVLAQPTADGLVTRGETIAEDSKNSLIYAAGGRLVAAIGLDGMVVVDTPDALLVASVARAAEVQAILARLAADDPRR